MIPKKGQRFATVLGPIMQATFTTVTCYLPYIHILVDSILKCPRVPLNPKLPQIRIPKFERPGR